MKRLLLACAFCLTVSPAFAAQQTISGGVGIVWGDEKTKINANFTELYGQAATKWVTGTTYTADNQIVVHGGNVFVCTSNHTAGSTTEPGVGVDWATVWDLWGAALYEPVQTAASQAEMEAGTESAIRSMSPLRVAQAIAALATGSDELVYQANCATITDGFCVDTDDQSLWYYDGSAVVAVGSDSDTLSGLDCSENQIAKWNGTAWACATDATAEAGTGDDLGDAVAADVVALFSGASGYLKSDGTLDTPTDNDSFSTYTVATTVGDPGTDTNIPSEQAVREALDLKADLTGTPNFSDGISTGTSSDGPGVVVISEDSDNGSNFVGVGSPASNNNDLILLLPSSDPTAGQALVCAEPSSVTFADGVARDATACSWVSVPTASSLSVDDLISLSGRAEGSTTIADPNGDITATTFDGALTELAAAVKLNTAKTSNATHTGDVTGATELTISADAVGTDELSNTLNLVTTGTVQGRVVVETDADGKTLDTGDNATMQLATGAGTWTLPDINDANGLGWTMCVLSTTAAAVVVAPNAEDTITMDGTTDTAGDGITSASAAGDFVCLMVTSSSSNVANWTVLGRSGTWTAN